MASFAGGKIQAYVGPPELGAADDLEQVIGDFIAGAKTRLDVAVQGDRRSTNRPGDPRSRTCRTRWEPVVTEHAALFDGLDDYVEIADHPDYSIASTGDLTVVAVIRPDSLEMPATERTGYVHWLGKGIPGQDEWTFRMYQLGNTEGRENRISCYAFNRDARAGGTRFGIGSHFQDELTPGAVAAGRRAWDATRVSIYRDGVLRDSDLLDQSATGGVTVTPEHGDAPVPHRHPRFQ